MVRIIQKIGIYTFLVKAKDIDPLMGWTGSIDTQSQVSLSFSSEQEAKNYAKANGIDFIVLQEQRRKLNIRKNGYGENFSYNRKSPWTH